MPQIFKTISNWRQFRQTIPNSTTLGFVPTMGNLHAGHESLLRQSQQENEQTVLSIFVNPTQFNDPKDLAQYPRTLEQDILLAEKIGVNYVLCPEYEAMYPDQYQFKIMESSLSTILEGAHRPNHFTGMLTVVMKLLQLIKATRAYFGEKDYQQLQLIKGLVKAFFIDTEIIACPTIRDPNGLALSSRNQKLSPSDYKKALLFPALLHSNQTCEAIKSELEKQGFHVDYVEDFNKRRLGAIHIGGVRLIDNTPLE